jgi:hypothetical protein
LKLGVSQPKQARLHDFGANAACHPGRLRIGIDTGGTLTDVACVDSGSAPCRLSPNADRIETRQRSSLCGILSAAGVEALTRLERQVAVIVGNLSAERFWEVS